MSDKSHSSIGLHDLHLDEDGHSHRRKALKRAFWVLLIVVFVLVVGGARTVISRAVNARELDRTTAERAKIYVTTEPAKPSSTPDKLDLPGTLQGVIESPLYARSTGYVVKWYKDIGAHVQKGDVIAELATPEVDQQLSQATANRDQMVASLELAKTSYDRWVGLRQKDAVSQQELDERHSTFDQATANLAAAQANVRRLEELEGFKRIVAPFNGIVTRRNIDVGDLIDAGNGGATRELFRVAQADPLRIYVYVPQSYAQYIKVGESVDVTMGELPGQIFKGTVARTAGAIDTGTRTLQTEVTLPNPDGKLLPGAYVDVLFTAPGTQTLIAPSNALLLRAEGPRIAVVDGTSHAHLTPVKLGREFGQTIEILDGLKPNDAVIINPPDSLNDGDAVSVRAPKPEQNGPGAGKTTASATESVPNGPASAPANAKPAGAPKEGT
ncbi:MAG: efflux RND transporter periplasmic adaptor subunit [Burkholderiaceae bacterium]|jgi:RND family efflux transporter MFP subunit